MTNSVSSRQLLESLANCIRERISEDSLDTFHDALEDGLKSIDDPHVELVEALANYVYQLRNGAIEVSDNTASLFREALTLLGEDASTSQGTASADQTAGLLERIDLEASGGFDALEAGEVPHVDRLTDTKSETLRIQNVLHRLNASLETLERRTRLTPSNTSFKTVFSRHRRLLESLTPKPRWTQSVPLTSLEELLTLQLGLSETEINMDAEGSVHPSYIPTLVSLVAQLITTFSKKAIRDIEIVREQDALEIQLTYSVSDSGVTSLRTSAINRGFLHRDAPLRDRDEMQYLLLPESTLANEQLIQSSPLLDHLQSLCARVVVESSKETNRVSLTLPADARSEQVTVFKHDSALFAVWTDTITDIDYSITNENDAFLSSLENEHGSFRVVNLNHTDGNHEACLFIDEGGDRVALFVDQLEPPGQLTVLDPLTPKTHVGGGVRLLDRRFVVLLSALDLDDVHQPSLDSQPNTICRLLVLGRVPLASSLSRNTYRVSYAESELDATAAIQEQLPQAVLVEQHELDTYRGLLTRATHLDVPVIVQKLPRREAEVDNLNAEFESITRLTELEVLLRSRSKKEGDLQP